MADLDLEQQHHDRRLYNLIAVPLALAGLVAPLFAAIAMPLSSLLVVGSSMRLWRGYPTRGDEERLLVRGHRVQRPSAGNLAEQWDGRVA